MAKREISDRAQVLLKALIERHIRDGQPVGSKTLLEEARLPVSAATVRNVMSDLEERGYLISPHTSAGRLPTSAGYRLFVDSLLQMRPVDQQSVAALRAELDPDKSPTELVQTASGILSSITAQAGVVTIPKQQANQLRQVEFLPLSGDRVLVILVTNEREVQNRIIHTARPYSEEELRQAASLLNQRFAGHPLDDAKSQIIREMEADRASIDRYMQATLELASKAFEEDEAEQDYVVAGETQLIESTSPEELERLQELFHAFQRKKDLLHLLERCTRAQGIQIFIGEEAGYEVLGGYSVVTAPYTSEEGQPIGVLGVIGPQRMAYHKVIPIVDITARMLSAALSK